MDTTQTETIATAADHRLPGCTAAGLKTSFEKKLCGRCGGSGKYSYCSTYGSMCLGCGGKGETLTKRGTAALAYFNSICSVTADAVRVGDVVFVDGCPGFSASRWVTVLAVGPSVDGKHLNIESKGYVLGVFPDSLVRVRCTPAERAATIAAALRYQGELTATGKPRAVTATARHRAAYGTAKRAPK